MLLCLCTLLGTLAFANEARAEPDAKFEWKPYWRRSNGWDYALTLSSAATALALSYAIPTERDPDWVGPMLFDRSVRDHFAAKGRGTRSIANKLSNVALYGSVLHVVIDAIGIAMLHENEPDVGIEMLSMDAEAYAVTLLLNNLTKRAAGRQRPYVDKCAGDPNYARGCGGSDQYASFYSGHAATSATSAGLICAQHTHLPLYGRGADFAACADAIVLTSLTGVLRVVSDNHYASDVIVGHAVGFATGYLMPTLLHFRNPPRANDSFRWRLLPLAGEHPGLTAIGTF